MSAVKQEAKSSKILQVMVDDVESELSEVGRMNSSKRSPYTNRNLFINRMSPPIWNRMRKVLTIRKRKFTKTWPKNKCVVLASITNVLFVTSDSETFPLFESMSSATPMSRNSSVRYVQRHSLSWLIWRRIWRPTMTTGFSLVRFVRRISQRNRAFVDIWEFIQVVPSLLW